MQYHCSRCHAVFGKEGEGGEMHCPRCKAEAGLEPEHKIPRPMMLFAAFLASALVASAVGGALSIAAG